MEERYLTVTALNKYIKYKFDHDTNLEDVLLEGEISNFRRNAISGHFYFTVKDQKSQISATMFAGLARGVKFEPKDGMKVYVRGNVSVYEPQGSYQINVKELKQAGIGDLYLQFEKLKKELAEKGLFDESHKRPIPLYPKTIGVVTSETGAAIRDIINTITRRYPLCQVILYPALVQGEEAKNDVARQIEHANMDALCDVLIVGRGGGSIEDLWAFNEPIVAYAIYNSRIPIISAVGHEIDFTIADFTADMRAATPTAGAELATPNLEVLKKNIAYYLTSYQKRMNYIVNEYKIHLTNLDRRLENARPDAIIKHKKELLCSDINKLNLLMNRIMVDKKNEFNLLISKLEGNNPLKIMDKGYSISKVNGKIITDVKNVKVDDKLETEMQNGIIVSRVVEVVENGRK